MRKLLNTIYVTIPEAYLALDGENFVCKVEQEEKLRVPFDNIENIVCFNYYGCSPALMGKCVEKGIPINFISPQGRFLAKICGETKGNVFLRVAQIDKFSNHYVELSKNTIIAKITNTKYLIKRSLHDHPYLREDVNIKKVMDYLDNGIDSLCQAETIEEIMGIEGNCASHYFSIFGALFTNPNITFDFTYRTKRPPLDPINAVLSFVYTLFTSEYAAALETVGLDSYIGFCHALRSGRCSLACDLVEEGRCIVERFVLTLFNLQILNEKDFEKQFSGAVWLNDSGRKKVLSKWQEKKRSEFMHPMLKKKIPFGLIPYVQSNLLAKYVRGESEAYIPLLIK